MLSLQKMLQCKKLLFNTFYIEKRILQTPVPSVRYFITASNSISYDFNLPFTILFLYLIIEMQTHHLYRLSLQKSILQNKSIQSSFLLFSHRIPTHTKDELLSSLINIKQKNQSGVRLEPKQIDRVVNEMLLFEDQLVENEYRFDILLHHLQIFTHARTHFKGPYGYDCV